mmetsp:Transcript_3811/g.10984  ORF Transcript_3811/g.10984 Transcript_3811/m.10984 type:complete len:213 (-) Transcript_3811:520-1158(-)
MPQRSAGSSGMGACLLAGVAAAVDDLAFAAGELLLSSAPCPSGIVKLLPSSLQLYHSFSIVSFSTKLKQVYASPSASSITTCCSPSQPKLVVRLRVKGLWRARFLYAFVPTGSSLSLLLFGRYHPCFSAFRFITPQWRTKFPGWFEVTQITLFPSPPAGAVTVAVTHSPAGPGSSHRATCLKLSPGPRTTLTGSSSPLKPKCPSKPLLLLLW